MWAPEVAHRLRATNLTVLRKPNKKFRPIGAECVWAKAISLMAVDAVMPALKTCFKNLQYGVGNNIELAIQKIRRDFHLKGSVAMLDGRNAYNAISRTAILSAVYGNTAWSPLWRVTRLLLGTEGLVGFYEKGQLVHSWKSTRGVRQGMVLGPVLFSIGTIATLRQLESSFSNASFTAYLDDVTVRHHRACWGRCARRPPGRCVPWALRQTRTRRRSSTKEGPWTCPRSTFGRLPACSVREWQTTQRAS
ncbi:SLACS reverse transcriptase [Trypanosoma cruzi]|uniref:SLACS reverse transcriptase n=1 Tax=Trypanosoma cruzi TaxID=5693 RepID=A0A2V2UJK9_TRYCR|nr:SLACS reverse transcriptase [Trypanosoma cruzi]